MQSLTEIEDIKSTLRLLRSKGWDDGVRILDQYEFKNRKFGECCTLQVLDYETCEWLPCKLNGKDEYSLNKINKIIRHDLDWDGPIRLAAAA
jgi:hypothetical protein